MIWHPIRYTPPDEELVVRDELGNEGMAQPTWYSFKTVKNPNKIGRWSSDIFPCEPYWDGGWLIRMVGLENPIKGEIIEWRYKNETV